MMKKMIIFCIFLLLSSFSWGQEIPPEKFVLIDTHTHISGESNDGFMYIDFPMYHIYTGSGVLDSILALDVTDSTKVIMGKGMSLSGNVGSGASTYLNLYDTLVEDDLFEIQSDGSAMIYYADQWISLLPGETWTETIETTAFAGFTGNLVVKFTVTNYGIWNKAQITHPGSTPAPLLLCGDVNMDGDVPIADALLVAQYYTGMNVTLTEPANADVNNDGKIGIIDALFIAQKYVGLSVTLVCPRYE